MNHKKLLGVLLAAGCSVAALHADRAPYVRSQAKPNYKRPASVPFPAENEPTRERVTLGKMLFFDTRLSAANSISCASCHNPAFAWGDGLAKGVGHGSKELARRTPTVLNTAFAELLFWDGRATSLEDQALGPIQAAGEMNLPLDQMVARVRAIAGYKSFFEKAYPGEGITEKTIAKAIASFERTVVSGRAPFDEWIDGNERAISESAKRGFDLFNTKAQCVLCHSGWNFTDDGFHNIGLKSDDIGRGKHLPQVEMMANAFKTPTLRDADQRAPFMHDGSEKTLEGVVEFYNRGGDLKRASLAREIRPLSLTASEKNDLCEFMRTLAGRNEPATIPVLPR